MTKLEKVVRGLECCTCEVTDTFVNECSMCPYKPTNDDEKDCVSRTQKDALELLKEREPITGETSDGYHTFNELYHHRAVLFSVIVANYPERAWKAKKHHDGTMYDGMFIVGIETPDGQATYHFDINPYWDMFNCKVREFAPEWDGHTPAQAIERISRLALLKEREAHLIAEDDFVNADHYGYIPAWTEERNGDQFWKCVTRRCLNSDTKRFRYWSNKPTDEQRRAVNRIDKIDFFLLGTCVGCLLALFLLGKL